jgi:hypothetical protein
LVIVVGYLCNDIERSELEAKMHVIAAGKGLDKSNVCKEAFGILAEEGYEKKDGDTFLEDPEESAEEARKEIAEMREYLTPECLVNEEDYYYGAATYEYTGVIVIASETYTYYN